MDVNRKIYWGAVWGLCFLASIALMQTIVRTIAQITPSNEFEYYLHFSIDVLASLPFFACLLLHVRGYVSLGEKYKLKFINVVSYVLIFASALIGAAALSAFFLEGVGRDAGLADMVVGFALIPYITLPAVIGWIVLSVRNRLGLPAIVLGVVGTIILFYGIYEIVNYLGDFALPEFLGSFIWLPVPEALFAVSGTWLFFSAARD